VSTSADAVVIGAGVVGSAVALELARSGLSVHVVDKASSPGLGSTSASSAIIRFNYSTRAGVALAWESLHWWRRWPEHIGPADQHARLITTGLVMLDVPVAPRARVLPHFDAVGVPYEEWTSHELAARVPALDPQTYWPPKRVDDDAFWQPAHGRLGAFFTPDAGYVDDPQLAAINLAAAAGRAGATHHFGRRVVTVERTSTGAAERVAGVTLDDGTRLHAPIVVNVAGPWSAQLNALAGVGGEWSVGTRGLRQEVHRVDAPPGYGDPGPVVADLDLGTYVRPTPGAGLLVGGTEPECDGLDWVDDPDAVSPHPSTAVHTAQVTRAARRFPDLQVPSSPRGVVGVYDVTGDWAPIYDRTELDGYYVAIGTSGNQFKNAPFAGRLMAELIAAVEAGANHDAHPVAVRGPHTGEIVDLGAFSRLRAANDTTGTVLG
jgi:glycine/D-amino acid oxidase-like deaminating enzyme